MQVTLTRTPSHCTHKQRKRLLISPCFSIAPFQVYIKLCSASPLQLASPQHVNSCRESQRDGVVLLLDLWCLSSSSASLMHPRADHSLRAGRACGGHHLPRSQQVPVPCVAGGRAQHGPPGPRRRRLLPPARPVEARPGSGHLERPLLGPHRLQLHLGQRQHRLYGSRRRRRRRCLPHWRLRGPPCLQRIHRRPSRHSRRGELARRPEQGELLRREPGGRVQPPGGRVDQAGEPQQVRHRWLRQGRERGLPAGAAGDGRRRREDGGGGVQERVPGVRPRRLLLPRRVRHAGRVPRQRVLAAVPGRMPGLLQLRVRRGRRDGALLRAGLRGHLLPVQMGPGARSCGPGLISVRKRTNNIIC